ncbi:MAG: cell division protein FtsL [Oscillospiraceae bacterium]|jgi:cell division protein FtsL|nr:cell division protein FtsL [Oscillospiraceae bacterium]
MAAAASQVAYDLSRFDNRARVREAVAAESVPVQALPVRAPRPGTRTQPVGRLSLWTVLAFMTAMALMFFIVYSYMRLTELSTEAKGLSSQIAALKKEEAILVLQKNSMIDLKEVERIATDELGMVKPNRAQVIYIDLSGRDHAEVLVGAGTK